MKNLRPTIIVLILILMVSSTALAGNIGGLRSAGNIAGLRSTGNIGGTRSASTVIPQRVIVGGPEANRFNLDSDLSGSFAGLIRMLLDAAALF